MANNSSRGFIFSLDAFVAFTLALVAIYSMIFFASIPSAYYGTLTQAHYFSKDTLLALSQTRCNYPQCPQSEKNLTVLDFIVFRSDSKGDVDYFIGKNIPNQYGYSLETSDDGSGWQEIYNTASQQNKVPDDRHAARKQKLSVSSYAVAIQYNDQVNKPENPYSYITCKGQAVVCDIPISNYNVPSPRMKIIKLTVFI